MKEICHWHLTSHKHGQVYQQHVSIGSTQPATPVIGLFSTANSSCEFLETCRIFESVSEIIYHQTSPQCKACNAFKLDRMVMNMYNIRGQ